MKNTFVKLTDKQIQNKLNFIDSYVNSKNAATGALLDANANVSVKNITTLSGELNKDINIQINRFLLRNKIAKEFDEETAIEYIRQLESHEIYTHDETSIFPYCTSITMYPLLVDGLKKLGGESEAPKHLNAFCGSFVNLVFAVSSQFAGACATVEWLMYLDYFARKDYGDNYLETNTKEIENSLQHCVYALNQPAAARNYQSVFWNISIFDKNYFESLFEAFYFPDGTQPTFESVNKLQNFFMSWFNNERTKSILTFPVVTAAMLIKDGEVEDKEFANMCSKELSEGNSFFIYQSDSVDSLASCCRLRNELQDNTFSYSLGAGGVATGSINVITINMNRLVQDGRDLKTEVQKIHKYQFAYRKLMDEFKEAGMLTVYDAGFIDMKKQFLTIGINGMVEAAESQGIKVENSDEYKNFVIDKLTIIYDENKKAKELYGVMFNTEFVPSENLGVKNSDWDKKDGYKVNRECYNSYFFPVESNDINIVDKFILHGKEIVSKLDGGSALHLNLEEYTTQEGYLKLINLAAKTGCNYFTFNTKITICNECENIDKRTLKQCPKCGSKNIDYATRIIGYLKRISSFSQPRQEEHSRRTYHSKE